MGLCKILQCISNVQCNWLWIHFNITFLYHVMSLLPSYVLSCHVNETLLMMPPKTKRQFHKQVGSFSSWRIESINSHLVIILVKYMLAKLMKEHTTRWKFHLLSNKSYGLQSLLAHTPKPLSLLTCSGSRGQVNEIWCVYICVCLYRSLYVKERMASHDIRQC